MTTAQKIQKHTTRVGECLIFGKPSLVHARIWLDGKSAKVHRVAWELAFGPIPAGLCVCHRCDNPPCVNPAHLFLGTHAENMADRNKKGRQSRGEKYPLAKLSEADVAEIKRAISRRENQTQIGRRFGVSQSVVSCIRHGKNWAHISIERESNV